MADTEDTVSYCKLINKEDIIQLLKISEEYRDLTTKIVNDQLLAEKSANEDSADLESYLYIQNAAQLRYCTALIVEFVSKTESNIDMINLTKKLKLDKNNPGNVTNITALKIELNSYKISPPKKIMDSVKKATEKINQWLGSANDGSKTFLGWVRALPQKKLWKDITHYSFHWDEELAGTQIPVPFSKETISLYPQSETLVSYTYIMNNGGSNVESSTLAIAQGTFQKNVAALYNGLPLCNTIGDVEDAKRKSAAAKKVKQEEDAAKIAAEEQQKAKDEEEKRKTRLEADYQNTMDIANSRYGRVASYNLNSNDPSVNESVLAELSAAINFLNDIIIGPEGRFLPPTDSSGGPSQSAIIKMKDDLKEKKRYLVLRLSGGDTEGY